MYRIAVNDDGSAGATTLVARLARGTEPTGVASGGDGRIHVALHGDAAVLVLEADGTELARVRAGVLDAPAGLALSTDGALFATTRPNSNEGHLVRISVAGTP